MCGLGSRVKRGLLDTQCDACLVLVTDGDLGRGRRDSAWSAGMPVQCRQRWPSQFQELSHVGWTQACPSRNLTETLDRVHQSGGPRRSPPNRRRVDTADRTGEPGFVCGVNPLDRAARSTSPGVGLLPGPNPSANPVGGEEEGTPALATTEFEPAHDRAADRSRMAHPDHRRRCRRGAEPQPVRGADRRWPTRTIPPPSDEAQQAWLDSSHRAGALNEEVLVAQETEQAATAAAAAAAEQVTAATAAAAAAEQQAAEADAAAAELPGQGDAFANASFRGARLSQMSVLLTADSAEDFLDQVSSLDRVAADTQQTLDAGARGQDRRRSRPRPTRTPPRPPPRRRRPTPMPRSQLRSRRPPTSPRASPRWTPRPRGTRQLSDSLSEQERQAAEAAAEAANAGGQRRRCRRGAGSGCRQPLREPHADRRRSRRPGRCRQRRRSRPSPPRPRSRSRPRRRPGSSAAAPPSRLRCPR